MAGSLRSALSRRAGGDGGAPTSSSRELIGMTSMPLQGRISRRSTVVGNGVDPYLASVDRRRERSRSVSRVGRCRFRAGATGNSRRSPPGEGVPAAVRFSHRPSHSAAAKWRGPGVVQKKFRPRPGGGRVSRRKNSGRGRPHLLIESKKKRPRTAVDANRVSRDPARGRTPPGSLSPGRRFKSPRDPIPRTEPPGG